MAWALALWPAIAAADAGTITDGARLKAGLDDTYDGPGGGVANVRTIGILASQPWGLRREPKLMLQPSRSTRASIAPIAEEDEP